MPFSAPSAMPATSVSATASQMSMPPPASRPKSTPQRPTIEPIDRSISPLMMT